MYSTAQPTGQKYGRTHHNWFPWKKCNCKPCFLLITPLATLTLFIEWHWLESYEMENGKWKTEIKQEDKVKQIKRLLHVRERKCTINWFPSEDVKLFKRCFCNHWRKVKCMNVVCKQSIWRLENSTYSICFRRKTKQKTTNQTNKQTNNYSNFIFKWPAFCEQNSRKGNEFFFSCHCLVRNFTNIDVNVHFSCWLERKTFKHLPGQWRKYRLSFIKLSLVLHKARSIEQPVVTALIDIGLLG